MRDALVLLAIIVGVTAVVLGAYAINNARLGRKKIEFKCLEHMVALDRWDAGNFVWCCPVEGCEAVVDPSTRLMYEGVKPPR